MNISDVQATKFGPISRGYTKIAAVDHTVLAKCGAHDHDNVRAVAVVMILSMIYQAALFSIVGHELFALAGQIRADIIAGATFLAAFIMAIDSQLVVRPSWFAEGIRQLKTSGGMDISGSGWARAKSAIGLFVRITFSLALAQLTAIFVSIIVFSADINARINDAYLKANAGLIHTATIMTDGQISRTTDAVAAQAKLVDSLATQVTALRQGEIDPAAQNPQIKDAQKELTRLLAEKAKADEEASSAAKFRDAEFGGLKEAPANSGKPGYGLRWAAAAEIAKNAKAHAREIDNELKAARGRLDALRQQTASANDAVMQRSQDQLPVFEKSLAVENTKLTELKENLAALIAGREVAITRAVQTEPGYVPRDDGLLGRVKILENIAGQDSKIAAVIILIDVISFSLELAGVLSRITSFVPTTYAMIMARDAYMGAIRIADEMAEELKKHEGGVGGGAPLPPAPIVPDEPLGGAPSAVAEVIAPIAGAASTTPSAEPVKRKRGRPRKHPPFTAITGGNGQESPAQQPEPPAPV